MQVGREGGREGGKGGREGRENVLDALVRGQAG